LEQLDSISPFPEETTMRNLLLCPVLLAFCVSARAAGADLPENQFSSLHELILPGSNDSQWMSVSWLPATNIWAARQKAAREGKPIFLWYMAGEPLGSC
jgi:hypothetical protein